MALKAILPAWHGLEHAVHVDHATDIRTAVSEDGHKADHDGDAPGHAPHDHDRCGVCHELSVAKQINACPQAVVVGPSTTTAADARPSGVATPRCSRLTEAPPRGPPARA